LILESVSPVALIKSMQGIGKRKALGENNLLSPTQGRNSPQSAERAS
jgi:hypothetical protein